MAPATTTAARKKVAEPLISVKEAATRLGLTIKTVYHLIDSQLLSAVDMFAGDPTRKRKTYRISPEELERFIGRHTTKKAANTNSNDN